MSHSAGVILTDLRKISEIKGPKHTQKSPFLYLQLLLSSLLFEVSWVLSSSHDLKFRSNTHSEGSLLINNKLLNTLSFNKHALSSNLLYSIFILSLNQISIYTHTLNHSASLRHIHLGAAPILYIVLRYSSNVQCMACYVADSVN